MAVAAEVSVRSLPSPPRAASHRPPADPRPRPKLHDPRIHLAITTFTIITIGMVWLDFRLSIPQVAVALLACGVIEIARTYRTRAVLAWPASALQTATSTALILRVTGMRGRTTGGRSTVGTTSPGSPSPGVLTKYCIRYQGRHVFNPSNIALVRGVRGVRRRADRAARLLVGPVRVGDARRLSRDRRRRHHAVPPARAARDGARVLRHVRRRCRRAGGARPVDHHAVVADADRAASHYWWVLVTLAGDVDLPVLHDHRSRARRPPDAGAGSSSAPRSARRRRCCWRHGRPSSAPRSACSAGCSS